MCAFLLVWLLCLEGLAKLLVDSDAVLHAQLSERTLAKAAASRERRSTGAW